MPQTTTDHARRRDALRAALARHEPALDALLVTDLDNVRYLAGFTGSNGAVLIAAEPDGDAIATDGRYLTQVAEQSGDLRAVIERDVAKALLAEADGTVGFEATALSYADHARLSGDDAPVLVPTTRMVETLREVKDDGEIELLRRACAISDQALAALVEEGAIRPGATETQVARRLENLMYEFGAEAVAFETIVAAGPNSAIPHHRPTDAVLAAGDFVKIDFGARFRGYHADETRTFVLGEPAAWQREIYDVVRAAQTAGREALVPGADVRAIDGAARSVIEAAGYGEQFLHGLGHGVGVQIHEAPTLGKLGSGTLSDGAVVTVEPGVYLPGRGGVRIEDTLVVRVDGPELLTRTTKDLIAL
ncbi:MULTISPECIES: M24 family metallopeptidase [Tsukamurella]|uniref:Aminopeptidase P family protein n=2 Tax=Tsukamurella TaxID=2060 RepID=A0A5C5S1T4_9ACTN|nr:MULTISPECIES: aminopeptidase P family protein [Tsukamurella]NMD57237.1 aminopeptidase P family protein [Tsukamurella columbiensis]TWS29387.1 aminopeptidase P family protein [Tsukamurella conjunctivitidis]